MLFAAYCSLFSLGKLGLLAREYPVNLGGWTRPAQDPRFVWVLHGEMVNYAMADTFLKRKKEQDRQKKKREKEAMRQERKAEKENRRPQIPGEDPDIAGIKPGPQPPLDW